MTAAFPELALYVVTRAENKFGQTDISSGVTSQDEYLRTVGALFCVYWLARIGIDGEQGFSFGVDNDWTPRPIPTPATEGGSLEGDMAKRKKFYENCDWRLLQQLLLDADILTAPTATVDAALSGGGPPAVAVNEERMLAMLALTAVRICCGGSNRRSGARLLSPTPHHPAPPSIPLCRCTTS